MKRAHVFAVVLAALFPISSASPADTSFRAIRTTSLPEGVRARDVRWAGPNEVYIGTGKGGVLKTSIDSPETADAVMPSADKGGFAVSGRIAVGQNVLFVGSPFGAMGWIPLREAPGK
jgi:hypothetical protein